MCYYFDFRLVYGIGLVAVFAATTPAITADKDDVPTLEARESRTNVFADKEVTFSYTVKATKAWRGKAEWLLAAENGRVLDRGESDIAIAPDKAGAVIVKLKTPEVRPGVILKAHMRVHLLAAGAAEPMVKQERPVYIFPANPFADRKVWLKSLKIHLFDPEKSTADALKQLDVPFDPVTITELADIKDGFLLFGAGVSFKDNPELSTTLNQLAAAGLPVLCLAPGDGLLTIPGADPKGPQPRAMFWRRVGHITVLDSRFDTRDWLPEGKVLDRTLTLKSEDGAVVAEVGRGDKGWPWLEIEYPVKHGRLLICGFGLFGPVWEAGPTPRYLFLRLLESMVDKTDAQIPDEKEIKP